MAKELQIEVMQRQQSRVLGGSSLRDLAMLLADEPEIFLVYDENVAWLAGEVLQLLQNRPFLAIAIDTSEEEKCMDTVLSITRQLMEAGASRKALVVAIGGGITTDLVGFAASIYKRGIRYANVPTTLLAQVDAAIGGKNGVNLDGYKNMLGTIVQPVFTFLCPEPLRSLPLREFKAGVAEMLKTFLLADADAYESAVNLLRSATNMADFVAERANLGLSATKTPDFVAEQSIQTSPAAEPAAELGTLAFRAAEIKAGIVQRDPFEQGERMKLNLGHTFAHAIEHEAQERGDDIRHGEAVAIGIILAAEMSDREGLSIGLAARLKADFEAIGLPMESPYPVEELRKAMAKDKKAEGGKQRFVLLKEPGSVIIQLADI
jgi:3-dehydroquinate synthetase